MVLETEKESGDAGANESEDTDRRRRQLGLRILFSGRQREKSYSNENAWKSTVERYKIPSEHSFQFVPPGPTMPSQCDSLPLLQLLNLKHQADPLHVCNQLL
jgi:hypothetical protein